MATREETAQVLARHTQELFNAWHHSPEELSALLTYVVLISDSVKWKKEIATSEASSLLLVFGGRIPEQGISEILDTCKNVSDAAACLIVESPISCKINPTPFSAEEMARNT